MKTLLSVILTICFFTISISGQCLEYDAIPPKCVDWIDPVDAIPIFFPHQFNCSRFWVCQPDLTDCLHECPKKPGGGWLYFDFNIDHAHGGPVCNWPWDVDCEAKPEVCGRCEAWQTCVECVDGTPGCEDGWMCTPDCKLDVHCNGDEYCDFDMGGDGNCQKGCREGVACSINNSIACGECTNHLCVEPECCTDVDCEEGVCIDGECRGCASDDDCNVKPCSTCGSNHVCFDPECCIDDDCASNEYCSDDHTCELGCNENSDCSTTDLPCSTCNMNSHECNIPECCVNDDCQGSWICENFECKPECVTDADCDSNEYCNTVEGICKVGCRNDAGCTGTTCSTCNDHVCVDPECCVDKDCLNPDKPICSEDNLCIAGCRLDSDCPHFNDVCNGIYDEETATCFFCDKDDNENIGSCTPGCVDDDNCPPTSSTCNSEHICIQEGVSLLDFIQFETESCSGCSSNAVEGGAEFGLVGGRLISGTPTCMTKGLDRTSSVDYAPNKDVKFTSEDDGELLDGCQYKSLNNEVINGNVTWTGQGAWTVKNNVVTFQHTQADACPSKCCVKSPLLQGETTDFTKCSSDCLDPDC